MIRITLKDLRLFFSDKKAVLLTFLMPVGLITLFVFAFGGNGGNNNDIELDVLVADNAQTPESKQLIAELDSLPALKVQEVDEKKLRSIIQKGDRTGGLIILPAYESRMEKGESGFVFVFDQAKAAEASMLKGLISAKIFRVAGKFSIKAKLAKKMKEEFQIEDSASLAMVTQNVDDMMNSSSDNDSPVEGMIAEESLSSPDNTNPALVQAVAGTAIMTLLFSVAAMGAGLLDEKEKGTLRRLLISPINPLDLLLGKMLSATLIGFLQLMVMMLFAWMVFGLPILIHLPALILTTFLAAFSCASFGMLIASVCTSRKQVEGLSTIVVLVMSAIGGSMMPTFFMPEFMQKLSMFSVNYWGVQAYYDIFWREFSWSLLGFRLMVLFFIGLMMILISIPFYRKNILKIG
ncbi:MAG: ABC transporter permease [Flavobacteriales bacterium]|nr:ABC transporter permease [Flavobacteriales bacterium]